MASAPICSIWAFCARNGISSRKNNHMANTLVYDRAYTGPHDLQAMIDLIKARPRDRMADFPGILDLQEMLVVPKIQVCTRLWIDPFGHLACFAILDMDLDSANLTFEVAPDWKEKRLEADIVAWAEAFVRRTRPTDKGIFLLESSAYSDNLERIAGLQKLGFERQAGGSIHLERSLADLIPEPHLPSGFIIRPIRGEPEAETWVELHRAAHGTEKMTVEYKLAMMRTPYYDTAMDLVAVSPDGILAAYCVCFINIEENALTGLGIGHTDPIATHPDFQRRGLSKALMLTGLSLLKERAMHTACLGTSSDNIAMQRTAEAVGFRITRNISCYKKPIHFD
jgi:mycothiol synthase